MKLKEMPDEEMFTRGHTACAGCGAAIAARNLAKVLGKDTVAVTPACCLLIFSATYPLIAWKIPYHHVAFENTAACATGMKRALKVRGKDDVTVMGIAGDGGTADIGLQALSGAAERNEDILYVMYDNEAYMNTGGQRSGATPQLARTATTPVTRTSRGKAEEKKNVPMILALHRVPYVATASVAYPEDLVEKVVHGKAIKGFRFMQINAPCPTGWGVEPKDSVKVARLSVESGIWPLYEIEAGRFRLTYKPRELKPVSDALRLQGRFRHLTDDEMGVIQEKTLAEWDRLVGLDGKEVY